MRLARLGALAFVMALGFLASSDGVQSQDKKEAKVKGQLPAGWKALDLTASQKEEVYKIQTEYRGKVDKLEDEIKKLKAEQSKKMSEVLTAEQKKKLIDAIDGGKKDEPKKKEESKKKDEPKKEDAKKE
ncbi:hypothetical protein [Zavarzinella formosa]|uniref:hypothetical protein n=1 Tax=Zavarzinella formosa TaxID=360055 RepID=UPI0002FF3E8C|nr:hypothetical protein [Zavarzinella formosa]